MLQHPCKFQKFPITGNKIPITETQNHYLRARNSRRVIFFIPAPESKFHGGQPLLSYLLKNVFPIEIDNPKFPLQTSVERRLLGTCQGLIRLPLSLTIFRKQELQRRFSVSKLLMNLSGTLYVGCEKCCVLLQV